jgi:UDP-N-acetylmuramoyl-L-alanyl-D-glutamate--2,6-diaminopimelate ligase
VSSPSRSPQASPTAQDVLAALRGVGVEPRSLCADSRAVRPGDVFLAYPGVRSDGRRFIADAVAHGAAALLWEDEGSAPENLPPAPPAMGVRGLRSLSGQLADLVYGQPSQHLWVVGVTGTNGKTSVTQWIAQSLTALGRKCAVVGTLGNGYPGRLREGVNTTPEAVSLQSDLSDFVAQGATACAMEVSSTGIVQGRVSGVHFAAAVFTNLTRDNLDDHGTMEAYAEAKRGLFDMPGLEAVVINLDDAVGVDLGRRLAGRGIRRIGFSLSPPPADCADDLLLAEEISFKDGGVRFKVRGVRIVAPLVGRFNVSNLMAVIGVLLAGGIAPADAAPALAALQPPPGRMETLGGQDQPLVVVDYAHTPDALEKALVTLRETAVARGGRLICLFGCGGNRDHGKRPQMGVLAARLADSVWLTSDNPRDEDPLAILAEIAQGSGPTAHTEPDRARAIAGALAAAEAADVVLLAGKGHETYQEVQGVRLPLSDRDEARRALSAWRARS